MKSEPHALGTRSRVKGCQKVENTAEDGDEAGKAHGK